MQEQVLTQVGSTTPEQRRRTRSSLSNASASMRTERKIRKVFRQDSRLSHRIINNGQAIDAHENGSMARNQSQETDATDHADTLGKLVDAETAELGRVKWDVFHSYFKNATYLAVVGMVGSCVSANALNVAGSFWLTEWTQDGQRDERRNDTAWRDYRLGIYGLFGILQGNIPLLLLLLHFVLNRSQMTGL